MTKKDHFNHSNLVMAAQRQDLAFHFEISERLQKRRKPLAPPLNEKLFPDKHPTSVEQQTGGHN